MIMANSQQDALVFYCNGNKIVERNPDPEVNLVSYLRNSRPPIVDLTGAKLACLEGGCGACTVMVSTYDLASRRISHRAVNACLASVCSVHGAAVTTVEGIGSTKTKLHPVQERIAKAHGTQCGFCTPGMVMSMYTLLRNNPQPTVDDIQRALGGNLCRCTGYRPIIEGFKTFTKEGCCGGSCHSGSNQNNDERASLYDPRGFAKYDPSQDLIFPPELMLSGGNAKSTVTFRGKRVTWYRPVNLAELLDLKAQYPKAPLICGNTRIGLDTKFKDRVFPDMIAAAHIPELNVISIEDGEVTVGSSVNLTRLEETLKDLVQQQPTSKTRLFSSILEMLRLFGSTQIRDVVTVGSNIVTVSPVSDLNPIFMSAMCTLELVSKSRGTRYVKMDERFFTDHHTNILDPQEILASIVLPVSSENEYFYSFKQSSRREFDTAVVNGGMRVLFRDGSAVIENISLVYGGVADKVVFATKTMGKLIGKPWGDSMLELALESLEDELPLPVGTPGGMELYRRSLIQSAFFKFYMLVLEQLRTDQTTASLPSISSLDKSAVTSHHARVNATQVFQKVPSGQPIDDPVGRPMSHKAAYQHATGEAVYVADIPSLKNELFLSMVYSQRAHAKILSMDPSKALALEGVSGFVSAADVPGENQYFALGRDDRELFATDETFYSGQPIGAVIAATQQLARRAAKLVEIEYDELDAILTTEDAIEKNSFLDYSRVLERGNLEEGFEKSDHVVEGELATGAQDHFYLETHCALVVPKGEEKEIEVFMACQSLTEAQSSICRVLGVPSNRVTCRVKRVGGAFGGKEGDPSHLASICAVAANKLGRPVRAMLDRDEDMRTTGSNHPFLGRYRVGCTKEGKLVAADVKLYANAGFSYDLSPVVITYAMNYFDNCYNFPTVRIEGRLCKTNLASNTAMRGVGSPQAMFIAETLMSEIAVKCGISQQQVREINFYQEGDVTPTNQKLEGLTLGRCWRECLEKSDYVTRRDNADVFNRANRWKKRGLGIVPVKYGVTFNPIFLNQAGAFVNIYTDGSVLVSTGGVEIGQGLFTKLQQIAARTLGIPEDRIHQSESNTDKVPNTSPTAGSTGSDLNGRALQNACQTLRQRLEPYMNAKPKGSWNDWVTAAYFDRVSLSTTGFYKTPDLSYDIGRNEGKLFHYYTYGAGVSEVEIDCLTGDHRILRTDIVMDVGESINPAIDIGQIEGGFVQGYGLFVLEDMLWSSSGDLLTAGPSSYNIPALGNIPAEFNVTLLKDAPNPINICSSKGVGEPPFFLGSSVYFAIKEAIMAARADEGLTGTFRLDSPAVAERIKLACVDRFTKKVRCCSPQVY